MKRSAALREADASSARAADVAFSAVGDPRMRPDGNQVSQARVKRAINRLAKQISELPASVPDLALLPNHVQTTVRHAELISLLRLPANARLQFGGREWLQDFDDDSCLIVTVPR